MVLCDTIQSINFARFLCIEQIILFRTTNNNTYVSTTMENISCFDEQALKDWSKDDKLLFYQAIKSYGSYNIGTLQEHIPGKTKEDIERAMTYFKYKALLQEEQSKALSKRARTTNHSQVPLNSWAKLLTETFPFNELRTETATALRLIADFEEIPESVCTDKIDFKKVYHTIANALEGKPLCDDKYVAAVLNKCIVETALTSKAFMKCNALKNALKEIKIHESELSPFIKPTENNELSIMRQLAMHKNYNPLNIPEEHLKFTLLS